MPLATDLYAPAAPPKALTVAAVVSQIRQLIERQFPAPLWIEGELSNCSYPASGHIYFSLVDETVTDRFGQRLVLPCAFFKGANQHLKFKLTDGLKVLCLGQITTYEGRGQYQLKVLRVEPKGMGALQLAFEQLKKRLGAEGLFEAARKRPIPSAPERVGVVTSLSGSAIHDMVSQLRGHVHLVLVPVKVQGDGAAQEIAAAVETANAMGLADVLIVGRGGGSVEDLWAFNEEPVARAIARSRIPVISAVGHQDDWTIADYVADLRASTPTDAAKRLVNARQALRDQAQELVRQLVEGARLRMEDTSAHVEGVCAQLRLLHPLHQLTELARRAATYEERLLRSIHHALDREDHQVRAVAGRLEALSPLAVLARGYSITFVLPQRWPSGPSGVPDAEGVRPRHQVLTDAASVQPGVSLETRLARGTLVSTVTHVRKEEE